MAKSYLYDALKARAASQTKREDGELALDDVSRVKVLSPGRQVFKRFIRNRLAVFGSVLLITMFVFSFFGPLFYAYGQKEIFYKYEGRNIRYGMCTETQTYTDYVINDDETSGENLEFERLYSLAANADYWRILNSYPGDFSYDALKASEPRNELFKAYKERKVIYCNMKQQAYYEISPVQPDVLLKDFVAIFHPELVEPDYTPTYYRLLT